jgi:hypothetical protein
MYFQTGQVIFVPEWLKREFVSILASFCVWTKSLMCKDVVNRDSTCQNIFQKTLHCEKARRFQIPCQTSERRVIPSGRPSVHCSIRPDYVSFPSERQTDKHHPSGPRNFPFEPSTVSRSFCSSLHPSGHLSSPSGRPSVIDQLQILSKFRIWED